jgi:hypothetical protein
MHESGTCVCCEMTWEQQTVKMVRFEALTAADMKMTSGLLRREVW